MVLALPGAGEAVGEARLQILQVLGRGCVCMDGRGCLQLLETSVSRDLGTSPLSPSEMGVQHGVLVLSTGIWWCVCVSACLRVCSL